MKKETLLKIITLNERVEDEATIGPHIFIAFLWSGEILFLSGKSQDILKRDVCGNHE